jgi:small basic protein
MNTLCAIIIIALLVIMGAIFHGCRMLLIEIYDPLSHLVVSSISLPHVIAYLLFFVISNLAGLIATNRILAFMVNYLQNPTSD